MIRLFAEDGLPRVEIRLLPARPEVKLGKNGKPKATGVIVAPGVQIATFPAYPVTSSPARLRALARELVVAAGVLERALDGQYPLA